MALFARSFIPRELKHANVQPPSCRARRVHAGTGLREAIEAISRDAALRYSSRMVLRHARCCATMSSPWA
jgi:hypothetical protein